MEAQVLEVAHHYLENVAPTGEHNLRASCPFHASYKKDRSFSISLETGAWICFHSDCGVRGSFIQLLRGLGLAPHEIDRVVEDIRPPVPIPEFLRIRAELSREPVLLPEYLLGSWGEVPESLLRKGFSEEILREHEVGIDKVNRRIVFPIRDVAGRLVPINGRALEDWNYPRYKVYEARRGCELYGIVEGYVSDIRRHLYGHHMVHPERYFIREDQCPPLIIVEGYKACLWMRQLGFHHTVALQGSSLSVHQRRLLGRLAGPFYVFLDHQPGKSFPDKYGRCAAIQIGEALSPSGRVFICQYPDTKPTNTQPDNLKLEEIQTILETSKTPTQLILEYKRT